jgi:hypothetical protein
VPWIELGVVLGVTGMIVYNAADPALEADLSGYLDCFWGYRSSSGFSLPRFIVISIHSNAPSSTSQYVLV